jgi:membrane protease YdiL (CAAX protease family)
MSEARRQIVVLGLLVAAVAAIAFVACALGLQGQFSPTQRLPSELESVPGWLLGLANAGITIVLYGLAGLAGVWFARRLALPGVYRPDAGWRRWFVIPMVIGVAVGVLLVIGDHLFALARDWAGFPHPPFPLSVLASAAAGIGEEILFRLFVMGLWGWLLHLLFRRRGATPAILWAANVIAAVCFAAAHLPGAMFLLGVENPAGIPPLVLSELLVLNVMVGLIAGELYMRDGLVAAVGVHFWADIVWHVLWPLVGVQP